MSKSSKFGVVAAAAVGTAFLTMAGCASQGAAPAPEPVAAPAPMPAVNSCKGQAKCKGYAAPSHHKKKHHASSTASAPAKDAAGTTSSTESK